MPWSGSRQGLRFRRCRCRCGVNGPKTPGLIMLEHDTPTTRFASLKTTSPALSSSAGHRPTFLSSSTCPGTRTLGTTNHQCRRVLSCKTLMSDRALIARSLPQAPASRAPAHHPALPSSSGDNLVTASSKHNRLRWHWSHSRPHFAPSASVVSAEHSTRGASAFAPASLGVAVSPPLLPWLPFSFENRFPSRATHIPYSKSFCILH